MKGACFNVAFEPLRSPHPPELAARDQTLVEHCDHPSLLHLPRHRPFVIPSSRLPTSPLPISSHLSPTKQSSFRPTKRSPLPLSHTPFRHFPSWLFLHPFHNRTRRISSHVLLVIVSIFSREHCAFSLTDLSRLSIRSTIVLTPSDAAGAWAFAPALKGICTVSTLLLGLQYPTILEKETTPVVAGASPRSSRCAESWEAVIPAVGLDLSVEGEGRMSWAEKGWWRGKRRS